MVAPQTQSLALTWRPELRFFEKRFAILRALEEGHDMWAFRVEDDLVGARLYDRWHELVLGQNRGALHMLTPEAETDRAWSAFVDTVKEIAPMDVRSMSVGLQYLAELPLGFDEAVGKGYGPILGRLETPLLKGTDWAILADLEFAGPPAAWGQTEFGIVSAEEAPGRLFRHAGRTGFVIPPGHDPERWAETDFSPVSFFAEFTFRTEVGSGSDALAELRAFWDGTRAQASTLVEGLKAKLVMDDTKEEVAS